MTTGNRIREARKGCGLTQKQLGERAGIAEPTIRRYELGKLNPKPETMQRIASALHVSIYALLDDEKRAWFDAGEYKGLGQGQTYADLLEYSRSLNPSEKKETVSTENKQKAPSLSDEAMRIAAAYDRADDRAKQVVDLTLEPYMAKNEKTG